MTIDVSTVRSFLAVVVGIQITMMLFAPLRFFLLRKGWRQRSTLALWSDVFFTFGWLLIMGWGWYMISLCIRDLTIRKVENSDLGVAKHFNPRSLIKVSASTR
jgi:hypothetical protein